MSPETPEFDPDAPDPMEEAARAQQDYILRAEVRQSLALRIAAAQLRATLDLLATIRTVLASERRVLCGRVVYDPFAPALIAELRQHGLFPTDIVAAKPCDVPT